MERWYAAQTRPNAEETAWFNLTNQGFSAYLPRYRKRYSHARRRKQVKRPLFPGYLFVNLDLERDRWRSVNATIGVRELVSGGGRPLSVPTAVIQEIRDREDEDGYAILSAGRTFQPCDPVRITEGPFAGMDGLFCAESDSRRVIVLLGLLGRTTRVRVPRRTIASVA